MTQHVFFRDFSLCRAAVLAGLIGLAALAGKVPQRPTVAEAEALGVMLVPVAAQKSEPCITDMWRGVDL